MRVWATSCLHLGDTSSWEKLELFKSEVKSLPDEAKILLLGDIADPTSEGMKQAEALHQFLDGRWEYNFVPGNNDWWMPRVREIPKMWFNKPWSKRKLAPWLHTFEGGNYKNLPWSHHHDMISREEEHQWAALVALDCPPKATVLASHFPFLAYDQSRGLSYAQEHWNVALQQTNIKTLVFGHLHEEYLKQISDEFGGRKVQVVSDHRERLLHEVIQ